MSKVLTATTALIRDTFREAWTMKIFWGFFGFSTVLIAFLLFLMRIQVTVDYNATVTVFGRGEQAQDVANMVGAAYSTFATFLYSVGMVLAVVAAAGLVPTMFEPGRIELLLSKPLSRPHLLAGRYLGCLLVIAVNLYYLVGSLWVIAGWKTGVWSPALLEAALLILFVFAILLAVITLASVVWESSVPATLAALGVMLGGALVAQRGILDRLLDSALALGVADLLYSLLPRIWDLGGVVRNTAAGSPVNNWPAVWSSALFGAAALALGMIVFTRRNY